MSESLKEKRRKLLDSLDAKLQERVNTAQEKYGETGGKVASGVAAGVSAAADFFTPEDATDLAMKAIPGGALVKGLKKIRKLDKQQKKLDMANEALKRDYADKVKDFERLSPISLAKLRTKRARDFKKGKITASEYAQEMIPMNEALKNITKKGS